MTDGEIKSLVLFNKRNEKFIWQVIISALIIDLPLILITTPQDKIIWIVVYLLIIIILALLFSIFKIINKSKKESFKSPLS